MILLACHAKHRSGFATVDIDHSSFVGISKTSHRIRIEVVALHKFADVSEWSSIGPLKFGIASFIFAIRISVSGPLKCDPVFVLF